MSKTTRERLLDVAEQRFATAGIAAVTTREIVEAAHQRNASAVSYHFGSRDGLLTAILIRRGAPVDARRAVLRDALGESASLRELVGCLVVPFAEQLSDAGGRSYLRIVAQLRGRFAAWRVASDEQTSVQLSRILDEVEAKLTQPSDALRHERVVAMIMLMTASGAERARSIDHGEEPALGHDAYVQSLVDMCAAVLGA